MRHHQELVGRHAPLRGHGASGPLEDVRHDRGCGHRVLLEHDSVEHTARRAGSSVSDAGDDRVAGLPHLLNDLLVRRHRRVVLAEHARLAGPVLGLQNLADPLQELVGVVLRVLDEPDPLASQRSRAVHVRDWLCGCLDGRIQDLHYCLTSLVVARDEVTLPQPGTNEEKAPARPPAARIRKSSGEATSGRSFASSPGCTGPGMRWVRLRCAREFLVWSKRNCRISFLVQPLPAMVRMCSPARATTYCGCRPAPPECCIESASVVSTPSASGESWL